MTITEFGPLLVEDAPIPQPAQLRWPDALSIVDTTEVRWFVPESLPPEIDLWFSGSAGFSEERRDTYLIDDRADVGVKRRFGEMLEVKVRQSLDGRIDFGEGLAGPLEVWRKWSPVDAIVDDLAGGRWVDVSKSIVKRRFMLDGTEMALSSGALSTDAGCDVEIAKLTVGAAHWWTFAFAAFGPSATRRDALVASWRSLAAAAQCSEPLGLRTGRAMGYPEWLALSILPGLRERGAQRALARSR